MEFDTNTKIVALVATGLIGSYLLFQTTGSSELEQTPVMKHKEDTSEKHKEAISILYLDDDTGVQSNQAKHEKTFVQKRITHDEVDETDDLVAIYDDSDKIKQYIEEKHLINLSKTRNSGENQPKSRYSVYADINQKDAFQKRNKSLPPMAPTIISGVFTSGSPYTVVVDSSVKQQAREIIVTDNNPDGTIQEAVKIPQTTSDTQEIRLTAPPAIGQ